MPITDLTYQPASSSAARTLKHNLALDTTPFLGREQEMADLDEMWTNPDCWLVTIAGPGGIGKTQLAQAYAAQLIASAPPLPQPRFPDSVYFVDLAAIRERSQQIDLATMAAQLLADL